MKSLKRLTGRQHCRICHFFVMCVCMIRGHHLKLKLKTEDQLNMWGTLQYSCFIRSQTCCMGGPSHQSDLHRGERKAETVETKWKKKKAYSGSKNMVCCIIWFIISIFSLHLWDSVRQMLPWFRTSIKLFGKSILDTCRSL